MNMTDDISGKLDVLIRLIAMGLCAEKSQKEQIWILHSAGLQPKEIAEILGTTPNTVSVALSVLRREGKKGFRTRKTKQKENSNENHAT